jgi:hypothetical protein
MPSKSKTKYHRKKKHNRRSKTRRVDRKLKLKYKAKRGGGSGNPYGIDQFNTPLTYSGNAGWYGPYPRSSDQILYQRQTPKMSYLNNLSLANEPIPGVNIADTKPLRGGSSIPLYRQYANILGENQLSQFYPGPTQF